MIHLDVRADIRQAERFLTNLRKNAVKKAAARAINDTVVTVRAEGARAIKREHPALKIGTIKDKMMVKRAYYLNLRGQVSTTGRPLSALLFQPRGGRMNRRGNTPPVSLRIGKNRHVVNYRGRKGFIVDRWGGEVYVRRFPHGRQLRKFRGPSLPGAFRARGREFVVIATERWTRAFPSRLKFEIERAKR